MYFINNDGEEHSNSNRDYIVNVQRKPEATTQLAPGCAPATTRVMDFRGGVFKAFLVAGPADYEVHILRNGSLNTILSGVFLDKLKGPRSPDDNTPLAFMGNVRCDPPIEPHVPQNLSTLGNAAVRLSSLLQQHEVYSAGIDAAAHVYLYRAAETEPSLCCFLDYWRWQMNLWNSGERAEFDKTMSRAFASYQSVNVPHREIADKLQ
jgi:hypothetical protein